MASQKKEVHLACWEMLHMEMISLLSSQSGSENSSSNTEQSNGAVGVDATANESQTAADDISSGNMTSILKQPTFDKNLLKMELIGYNVGMRLAERYTKERARFQDPLETIKFICKEFWTELFRKQIDNLKRNNKGVYLLNDNKFEWLSKLSGENSNVSKEYAAKCLLFPCGLIRGALTNLGLHCEVSAEITTLPGCNFTVKLKG